MAQILVVDDNPVNLRVCRLILERFGHTVVTEISPVAALKGMETALPDVLVTDLMMPVLDGIALTRQVRALSNGKQVPIIILTARGEDDDQERAMQAGATSYLTKPVSSGALSNAVDSALGDEHER